MTRLPLPPLPTLTDFTTSRHPALTHLADQLADRPDSIGAMYDDSPYVPAATPSEETR